MSVQLQSFLRSSFARWQPSAPVEVSRTKHSVTLQWRQETFSFLHQHLLYKLERKDKVPPWVIEYSGNKTMKEIYNLSPSSPHKFRLRVSLRVEAIPTLADQALTYFGNEQKVYEMFSIGDAKQSGDGNIFKVHVDGEENKACFEDESGEANRGAGDNASVAAKCGRYPVLRSQWSPECWTGTEAIGYSPTSFCFFVRGGYYKQVQTMLEERPALLDMINPCDGYMPLAIAAIKGDAAMVKLLVSSGAEVDALSCNGRTALHVALMAGHRDVAATLIDRGAHKEARDIIGLRAEHCAVDGGNLDALRLVLARGGDLTVTDGNGWTPLYRAGTNEYSPQTVVGGAPTAIIEELVRCGSDVTVCDTAGLPLLTAVRLMTNQNGIRRMSAVRAVDPTLAHDIAVQQFTKLTRKIRTLRNAVD